MMFHYETLNLRTCEKSRLLQSTWAEDANAASDSMQVVQVLRIWLDQLKASKTSTSGTPHRWESRHVKIRDVQISHPSCPKWVAIQLPAKSLVVMLRTHKELPSGNHQTWLAGKSAMNAGFDRKITYNTNGPFSMAMLDYRRVSAM